MAVKDDMWLECHQVDETDLLEDRVVDLGINTLNTQRPLGCRFLDAGDKVPSGKRLRNFGKSPFFMGKSTISMAMFNSFLYVYQRVAPGDVTETRSKKQRLSVLQNIFATGPYVARALLGTLCVYCRKPF